MEAFVGKWKVDISQTKGLEEYGKAFGFPDQMIEVFKKTSYSLEYSRDGDKWRTCIEMDGFPTSVYVYNLGEAFDYKAPDGSTPKLTVTVDGNKLLEKYAAADGGKEWTTERELVPDGTLSVVTTFKGTSVHQILKKA